jgi:hypothetical protein
VAGTRPSQDNSEIPYGGIFSFTKLTPDNFIYGQALWCSFLTMQPNFLLGLCSCTFCKSLKE